MDIGYWVGFWLTVTGVIVGLLWAVGFFFGGGKDSYSLSKATGLWGILFSVVIVLVFVFTAYPPFNMTYHKYTNYSGTVKSVEARLIAGDKSTNQVFLVKLEGQPGQFRLDDTRGAGLKPGDQLTLRCKPEWQYAAAPGQVCNYVRSSEDN